MKAVDESCDVASATQNGADLLNLLDGPPTQKPVLHHKKSVSEVCKSGLPHPGKVVDFFCCSGKSLNSVFKSWEVLENVYKVFPRFTRTECEVVLFYNN